MDRHFKIREEQKNYHQSFDKQKDLSEYDTVLW